MLYLCFCFPALTKWRDCSSGTHREKHTGTSAQNETRQTAQRCFFSRAHYRRSSFSLLSSFFQLCLRPLLISSLLGLDFFFPSIPLHVLLDTPPKVNTAWKWITLPRLRPLTIYDCAEGHLLLFSFWIPLFFCGNSCLDSFPILIHFQERHNRKLVCRNALPGKVRLGVSNMTLLEANFCCSQNVIEWTVYQVKIRYPFGGEHTQRSEVKSNIGFPT